MTIKQMMAWTALISIILALGRRWFTAECAAIFGRAFWAIFQILPWTLGWCEWQSVDELDAVATHTYTDVALIAGGLTGGAAMLAVLSLAFGATWYLAVIALGIESEQHDD